MYTLSRLGTPVRAMFTALVVLGDPVAYGQKTALRPWAVYRRKGLHSSRGLHPSFCPKMRALAGTQLFPGEPKVAPW